MKLGKMLRKNNNLEGTRIVVGSRPAASNAIWGYWENAGFRVKLANRDPNTNTESLVDDFLHAQIFNEVVARRNDGPGDNTLVLCTGDGNLNDGYATFISAARSAALASWRVEVWAWRNSCSRNFRDLAREFPNNQFSIIYFDNVADQMTYQTKSVTISEHNQKASAAKMSSGQVANNTVAVAVDDSKPSADEISSTQEDDEATMCVICLDAPRTHAIIPCGHYCLCSECNDMVTTCPMCNGPKTNSVKVYYS
jgi:hypothetical protein